MQFNLYICWSLGMLVAFWFDPRGKGSWAVEMASYISQDNQFKQM